MTDEEEYGARMADVRERLGDRIGDPAVMALAQRFSAELLGILHGDDDKTPDVAGMFFALGITANTLATAAVNLDEFSLEESKRFGIVIMDFAMQMHVEIMRVKKSELAGFIMTAQKAGVH